MTKTKSIKSLLITFFILLFAFCISLVGANTMTVYAADGDNCKTTGCTGTYTNGICSNGCYEPADLVDNAYQIGNAGQLYWFATQVNGGKTSINAVLTANIVINEKVFDDDGSLVDDTSALRAWTPIDDYAGIFDGNGHTISGLYEGGLFDWIEGGTVKNVGIINSYMIGDGYDGSIAIINRGTVENCYSNATIQTTGSDSGGLVASNNGVLRNCYYVGTIEGNTSVGAIVSCNGTGASIINCYFSSNNFSGSAVATDYGSIDELTCGKSNTNFANGAVAYRLGSAFGQKIGTDAYPVFKTADNTVYYRAECNGTMVYSNLEKPDAHDANVTATNYFNTDGTCKACGAQAAASVLAGEATYYFTDLQTALSSDAAKSGTADAPATVTLLSDASAESGFSIHSAHIILDLNGFNVNSTGTYSTAIMVRYGGITVRGNGTVTGRYALDSSDSITKIEGGTLEGSSYGISASGNRFYSSELHISGGTVSGGKQAINYSSLSGFTISGGTFRGKFYDNMSGGSAVQPVITGGSFPEGIVLGDECPALSALLGEGYCYSDADGKKVTLTDGQKEITGSVTVKKDISGTTVTVEDIILTYDGTAKEPTVTVSITTTTTIPDTGSGDGSGDIYAGGIVGSIGGGGANISDASNSGQVSDTVIIALREGVDYRIEYSNNINAGTATVTVIGLGGYAGQAETTFTVNKKTVTVTAENKEVEQFTALPEFSYTVDGMLDGDEFTTAPVASVTISDTNTFGEYVITVSGGENSNYEFGYVNAKLTVTEHTTHRGGTATCTAEAVCEICGEDYGELLEHDYAAATCTVPKTCNDCGATTGEALGHSFTEYESDNNATCTEDGTKTAVCDNCEETDTVTEEGTARGHNYGMYARNDTEHWKHCVNDSCNHIDEATRASHTYGEWTVTKEATEIEAGEKTRKCICGHEQTETILATGHKYDNDCDGDCNTCGEERTPAEHIDADENNACDECGAELPKDGLSGGAIAGIAVGSTAVVGGGCFALFWFVFRKKRRI